MFILKIFGFVGFLTFLTACGKVHDDAPDMGPVVQDELRPIRAVVSGSVVYFSECVRQNLEKSPDYGAALGFSNGLPKDDSRCQASVALATRDSFKIVNAHLAYYMNRTLSFIDSLGAETATMSPCYFDAQSGTVHGIGVSEWNLVDFDCKYSSAGTFEQIQPRATILHNPAAVFPHSAVILPSLIMLTDRIDGLDLTRDEKESIQHKLGVATRGYFDMNLGAALDRSGRTIAFSAWPRDTHALRALLSQDKLRVKRLVESLEAIYAPCARGHNGSIIQPVSDSACVPELMQAFTYVPTLANYKAISAVDPKKSVPGYWVFPYLQSWEADGALTLVLDAPSALFLDSSIGDERDESYQAYVLLRGLRIRGAFPVKSVPDIDKLMDSDFYAQAVDLRTADGTRDPEKVRMAWLNVVRLALAAEAKSRTAFILAKLAGERPPANMQEKLESIAASENLVFTYSK